MVSTNVKIVRKVALGDHVKATLPVRGLTESGVKLAVEGASIEGIAPQRYMFKGWTPAGQCVIGQFLVLTDGTYNVIEVYPVNE